MLGANPTQSQALDSSCLDTHKIQTTQAHFTAQVNAWSLFKQYFQWQYGEINVDFNYALEALHGLAHKK